MGANKSGYTNDPGTTNKTTDEDTNIVPVNSKFYDDLRSQDKLNNIKSESANIMENSASTLSITRIKLEQSPVKVYAQDKVKPLTNEHCSSKNNDVDINGHNYTSSIKSFKCMTKNHNSQRENIPRIIRSKSNSSKKNSRRL